MTAQSAPHPRTEQRILAAAGELFAEKGYASTSTRELAARVGVRSASVYHHFRSKQAILYRICVDSLERITAATAGSLQPAPSVEAFAGTIRAHLTAALRERDMHATMLMDLRRLSGAERTAVLAARDRHEALLRHEVDRMRSAGLIRGDLDSRLITLALLNLLNGTIFWYREDGSLDADALATSFAALFLEGALAGPRTDAGPDARTAVPLEPRRLTTMEA